MCDQAKSSSYTELILFFSRVLGPSVVLLPTMARRCYGLYVIQNSAIGEAEKKVNNKNNCTIMTFTVTFTANVGVGPANGWPSS